MRWIEYSLGKSMPFGAVQVSSPFVGNKVSDLSGMILMHKCAPDFWPVLTKVPA